MQNLNDFLYHLLWVYCSLIYYNEKWPQWMCVWGGGRGVNKVSKNVEKEWHCVAAVPFNDDMLEDGPLISLIAV